MTDKFHYQDVIQTINIPQTEQDLALEAKNYFDIAHGVKEPWDPEFYRFLQKKSDSLGASQVFFDSEASDNRHYHRLVLTLQQQALRIALEYRDFDDPEANIRRTLSMYGGESRIYSSDLNQRGRLDNGSTSEIEINSFKENFFITTAQLGLRNQIRHLDIDQNESSSAIFASAA